VRWRNFALAETGDLATACAPATGATRNSKPCAKLFKFPNRRRRRFSKTRPPAINDLQNQTAYAGGFALPAFRTLVRLADEILVTIVNVVTIVKGRIPS
jgi:hypothetical protein